MRLISNQSEQIIYKGCSLKLPLFLDHQSTTPVAPEVLEMMSSAFEIPGNAASQTHVYGFQAKETIETARQQISDLIAAHHDEIYFTSGATESNARALLGYAQAFEDKGHIISINTEHNSVLTPLKQLESEGFDITYLPVQSDGRLSLQSLKDAIRANTILVSIQWANSETGNLQEIEAIGSLCKKRNIAFHTDAVQAISTQEIDVNKCAITLLSLSAHKLYGPQGIGALYIKRGTTLSPSLLTGTQPTALIAGLGTACALVGKNRNKDNTHLLKLSKIITDLLNSKLGENVWFNGNQKNRIPGCLNIGFKNVDAEDLLLNSPSLALSTGSACTSDQQAPSHVLSALGLNAIQANNSVRIGLGRYVTEIEAEYAANVLINSYNELKKLHE